MRLKEIVINLNLELQAQRVSPNESSGNEHQQSNEVHDFLDQPKKLKIDQCASMCTNKDVGKLVQSILTTVYEPVQLKNRSVTGAISKNPKNTPKKLEFIIGK